MENAQKALLIAATLLISIMVIGIFVYVFRAGGEFSASFDKKQLSGQLQLYNSKFEVYNKPDNTIMDLITVCNLAYNINSNSEYNVSDSVRIEIEVEGKKLLIPETAELGSKLNKNQILLQEEPISIFDLCEKPWNYLGDGEYKLKEEDYKNKLNITHLGNISYKETYMDKDGNIHTVDKKKYATVYKYYFNCTDIQYHVNDEGENTKIKYMKFERNIFPIGSDKYWNTDWEN